MNFEFHSCRFSSLGISEASKRQARCQSARMPCAAPRAFFHNNNYHGDRVTESYFVIVHLSKLLYEYLAL